MTQDQAKCDQCRGKPGWWCDRCVHRLLFMSMHAAADRAEKAVKTPRLAQKAKAAVLAMLENPQAPAPAPEPTPEQVAKRLRRQLGPDAKVTLEASPATDQA